MIENSVHVEVNKTSHLSRNQQRHVRLSCLKGTLRLEQLQCPLQLFNNDPGPGLCQYVNTSTEYSWP